LLRTRWGRCSEAGLLYVHVAMTHGKRLSYPNSAVFADTVVPFRCHRTIIRWLHDGIARASRSRVAFLRQSGSFLFPSCCLREAKNTRWHRWSHEVKTKMTRFDKMPSRWPYEGQNGHTNSTRKWTFARSFVNLLACKRFCHRSRSCCLSLRNSTGGHTMPSRMARWFYDQSQIWTFPLSCVHLVSISGQCDANINNVIIIKIKGGFITPGATAMRRFAMSFSTSLSHRSDNARHCWTSLEKIFVARIIAE
jgi:hypothetical protein